MAELVTHFLELIRRTATNLPPDILAGMKKAADREGDGTAGTTLRQMLNNVDQSSKGVTPLCQDTGTPIFYVDYGPGFRQKTITEAIRDAAVQATEKYYLRPNAVDAITGKNSGNNLGEGFPSIHFHEVDDPGISVRLMLKGGGSENVGAQYSLPDGRIKAGRDLDGVRRCVIDAVHNAQGKGCSPGTVGVGIGGDRISCFTESKEQLFRMLDDKNDNAELAALEDRLYEELNQLGIGPMGFGGKTTVLGVKIGARHRVPASFFVSISYVCWAYRRGTMVLKGEEVSYA